MKVFEEGEIPIVTVGGRFAVRVKGDKMTGRRATKEDADAYEARAVSFHEANPEPAREPSARELAVKVLRDGVGAWVLYATEEELINVAEQATPATVQQFAALEDKQNRVVLRMIRALRDLVSAKRAESEGAKNGGTNAG